MRTISFDYMNRISMPEEKHKHIEEVKYWLDTRIAIDKISSESLSVLNAIQESFLEGKGLFYFSVFGYNIWIRLALLLEESFGTIDRLRKAFLLEDKKYNMPSIEYLLIFLYSKEKNIFKKVVKEALNTSTNNKQIQFFKQDFEDSDFWHKIKREYDFESLGLGFDFDDGRVYLGDKLIIYSKKGWIIDIKKTESSKTSDFTETDKGKTQLWLRQLYAILKIGEGERFCLNDLSNTCEKFAKKFKSKNKFKDTEDKSFEGTKLLTTQINKLLEEIGYEIIGEKNRNNEKKYILQKKRT